MRDSARIGIGFAASIALQTLACTAELVAVPTHDAGARQPSDERPSRPGSGAAGSRARRPIQDEMGVATSDAPQAPGVDTLKPPSDDGVHDDAGVTGPTDATDSTRDANPEPEPDPNEPPPLPPPSPPLPTADDCITDPSAGDHTFSCDGLTFLLQIDPQCERAGCGLIVDLHGRGTSGLQMRDATQLHVRAPSHGYLVLHPSATAEAIGGVWTEAVYPQVAAFIERVIGTFGVDRSRVHITGFSDGADMTVWFLCNHGDLFASAAAASRVTPAADCLGRPWQRQVPMLYMHGTEDTLTILQARAMIDDIVERLSLGDGAALEMNPEYTRMRWQASDAALDYIEHTDSRLLGGGHCVPSGPVEPAGGPARSVSSCTLGTVQLDWGELALQWFLDHPRPTPSVAGP